MSLVTSRRFFNHVAEWRVGSSTVNYEYLGEASGLGPVEFGPIDDPVVRIQMPGARFAVKQLILNYDGRGSLEVRDYGGLKHLLYGEVDVDADTDGVQTAVSYGTYPSRTAIDYFVVVVNNTEIVNATDLRTAETSTFTFSGNVYIGRVTRRFSDMAGSWVVEWYYDKVSQVDA